MSRHGVGGADVISGVYENVEGSVDLAESVRYWALFGYRPVAEGTLSADDAERLYGHRSALRSIRLQHLDSDDHGLLRVMGWERLRDDGVGLVPPLTIGGRWFIAGTRNILALWDAFNDLQEAGDELIVTRPERTPVGQRTGRPTIYERRAYVREMMALSRDHRQAWFCRFNYDRPDYGTFDESTPFATTEATHSTVIVPEDTPFEFYSEVLDLPLIGQGHGAYGEDPGEDAVLCLQPGHAYRSRRFLAAGRSIGMVVLQSPLHETPNLLERSRIGSRGLCCFTFRVDDVAAYRTRLAGSAATEVSTVCLNEFGEASVSFVAPGGVGWVLVEGRPSGPTRPTRPADHPK
jgi:hypothetical protein